MSIQISFASYMAKCFKPQKLSSARNIFSSCGVANFGITYALFLRKLIISKKVLPSRSTKYLSPIFYRLVRPTSEKVSAKRVPFAAPYVSMLLVVVISCVPPMVKAIKLLCVDLNLSKRLLLYPGPSFFLLISAI